VGKVTCVVVAALAAFFCFSSDAVANGVALKRHAARVAPVVVAPLGCPDRFSCYSLYGAYGPYGGRAYWPRYTYGGWNQ